MVNARLIRMRNRALIKAKAVEKETKKRRKRTYYNETKYGDD